MKRRAVWGAAAALLGACAGGPKPNASAAPRWEGRFALSIESTPPERHSAAFELQGSAAAGSLRVLTPLGTTAALLEWAPGIARWVQSGAEGGAAQATNLEALMQERLGFALPVAAMLGWLAGEATNAPLWAADTSALAQGRISATRQATATEPRMVLRVVLLQS